MNPNSLIPLKITQLPEDPAPSNTGWMMYVNNGVTYKVQVNAVLNVSGVPTSRTITAGAGLTGGGDLSQNRTISVAVGGIGYDELANSGVTPGTYGSSTEVPLVTVDEKGRITSITTASITTSGFVPTSRQIIAGTGLTGGGALNADVTLAALLASTTPLALGAATAGVANISAREDHVHPAVDLSDLNQTNGVLDPTRGGTGTALTAPAAGGVAYSDGQNILISDAGTAGQALLSNGAGEPYWGDVNPVDPPQPANYVHAGPASGPDAEPTWRPLVDADIPWDSMTGGIATPDYIKLDTAPSGLPADAEGLMYWNTADGSRTLNIVMAGGDVVQQVGQELFYRVKASATITSGQCVMFTGAVGVSGQITAAPATGLSGTQGDYVIGVATEDIATGAWGYITCFGFVRGLNTTAWAQGDILYYDPAVAGGLTKTRPNAPYPKIEVAAVVTVNANNGELLVRVTHGSTLGYTDSNVQFGSLASGDLMIYNATGGYWVNNPLTAGTAISIIKGAGTVTVTNTAPDQVVSLTQGGTTTITGTYPNFTISSADQYTGTVTSVAASAGTGISVSGSPITSSGTLTITNTAPDQVVTLTQGGTTTITGTYPSFTISSADQYTGTVTSVAASAGAGISVSGGPITTSGTLTITNTDPGSSQAIFKNIAVSGQNTIVADTNNDTLTVAAGTGVTLTTNDTSDTLTITNAAPDQVVSLTQGGTTTITGTYPNFTISSADQYVGTVTSVAVSGGTGISISGSPITSSGTITVTNSDPGSAQNIFKNIAVAGQSTVVADSNNDTLTLIAGTNVTITTDAGSDSITISSTGGTGGVSDYYSFTFMNMGA